jgi:4-diphosphocytidyl-2-C-methyl-D-erythritol kinase
MIVLRPSAKINLTLHVGRRREDGFHDVRTVMQSLALSDRLTLARARGPLRLVVPSGRVSADPTNLVWRAAQLVWHASGRAGEPHGVTMTLDKAIPVAAGLGGGSADAAAALAGLNQLWKTRLSPPALLDLAAQLGSDVPFFLVGGTALAMGRGEQLYPLSDAVRLHVVVIKPAVDVSTADAYRWFDEAPASGGSSPAQAVEIGWPTGPLRLVNDLQAPVSRRHPEIAEMVAGLISAGAGAAMMSGSGSSVFGVFSRPPRPRALAALSRPGRQIIVTRTIPRREALRRMGII